MKKPLLFLLLTSALTGPVFAETPAATKAQAPTALFSSATSLKKSLSCFSEPFQSYESYIAFRLKMAKNRPNMTEDKLRAQLPQTDYERFLQKLDCQAFVYDVAGVPVRGFMLKPKQIKGKAPVVIYNRGGNAGYGQLVFGYVMHELMPIAEQGFVVIASNYRGAHNWGKTAPAHAGADEFGGAELADVKALLPIVQGMKQADASRLAMWGHSRGGMMTYMLAKSMPELKTIVIGAGVADLAKELDVRPAMEHVYEERIPNYTTNKKAVLTERSALLWAEQLPANLPVLLQHGDQDKQVSVGNAEQMALKLKELKRPHQLLIYPGADHSFNPLRSKAQQDMINWLKKYLG